MLQVHIIAGLLAILAGFVALFAPKGAHLHRRFGRLFAAAMAVMLTTGAPPFSYTLIAVPMTSNRMRLPLGLPTVPDV